MDRRNLIAGGVGLLLAGLFAGSASARIPSQAPVSAETGPAFEEVKRGGNRGGRGRHRGWGRGRGKAWGRRRKFGW